MKNTEEFSVKKFTMDQQAEKKIRKKEQQD